MSDTQATTAPPAWQGEATGPATLAQVMQEAERQASAFETARLRPLATGFDPLDDVLNGGLRPGELLVIGGTFGVGKTIWGLQAARNAVATNADATAIYVCYEHDRTHLLARLLCLESAEQGYGDHALTLRQLSQLTYDTSPDGGGLISRLRNMGRYAPLVAALDAYAERLVLVKASGDLSTLSHVRGWVEEVAARGAPRVILVVDYLQKIPLDRMLPDEVEVTTTLVQGLKDMAMTLGIRVIAIAAADRPGLKARRMRLSDLRGSSAVQYEADIGLVLNNKYTIISREHLVYNPTQAESMRNYVVLSVEKNRAGRNTVDMEFALDAAHFRIVPVGDFVRERLIDEKVVRE